MDTNLPYCNLSFVDTRAAEMDAKNDIALQNEVDEIIELPEVPTTNTHDDVLEDVLSIAKSLHFQENDANALKLDQKCEICRKTFDNANKCHGYLMPSKEKWWHWVKCPNQKPGATKVELCKNEIERPPTLRAYNCPHCSMAFHLPSKLQNHILKKHQKLRKYKCDECDKAFTHPSDLKKHKTIHSKTNNHSCSHCGKTFNDPSNLKRHIISHLGIKPYACIGTGCRKRYQQIASLKRHTEVCPKIQNVKIGTERQFYCRACGLKFQYSSSLREHFVKEHTITINKSDIEDSTISKSVDALVNEILCEDNNYQLFNTNNVLNEVDTNLTPEEPAETQEVIPENHDTDNVLNDLNQIQTLDEELDIDFDQFQSGPIFNMANDLDYALNDNTEIFFDFIDAGKSVDQDIMNALLVNPDLPDELLNVAELNFNDDLQENVLCLDPTLNECSTIFESDVDLASTNLTENLNQLISENNVQYISTEDDDTFIISLNSAVEAEQLAKFADMLNIGIELVDNNEESLTETGESEKNETGIPKVAKVNKKERKYTCKNCKKIFKKMYNYRSHLATHEPKLRRHRCEICGKRFSYRSTLTRHIAAMHEPKVITTYSCNLCSKSYKAKWLMNNHKERDHFGMAHYACDFEKCNKKFYKHFDLVIHKRSHTREMAYECSRCHKKFIHASHLKRHSRSQYCSKQNPTGQRKTKKTNQVLVKYILL